MRQLAEEFVSLSEQDSAEGMEKRFGNVLFVITRPWATTIFNKYLIVNQ